MLRSLVALIFLCPVSSACSASNDNFCDPGEDICPDDTECVEGQCVCIPECDHRECGPDQCGGECPPGCADGETCYPETGTCGPGPGVWVRIEPGTFMMGSPATEAGHDVSEVLREVTLTYPFEILSTEVTQDEFFNMLGYNTGVFRPGAEAACGPTCPMENVTWHQAAAYCNALSDAESLERCYTCYGTDQHVSCEPASSDYFRSPFECEGYRLPTEAEWEYAARAGDPRATYNGELDPSQMEDMESQHPNPILDPIAWFFNDDAFWPPVVGVGQLAPNAWGLYDMLGHVREWCSDMADWPEFTEGPVTNPHVWTQWIDSAPVRGCDWTSLAIDCRAASRSYELREERGAYYGFRPVRSLE